MWKLKQIYFKLLETETFIGADELYERGKVQVKVRKSKEIT